MNRQDAKSAKEICDFRFVIGCAPLFPCGEATFKTEAGGWAYRDLLPARAAIQRITLLVYSPASGELQLSQPRIIRADRTPGGSP